MSFHIMANWIDLLHDVLERVSDFCAIPDHIRMQSVCKSWRSILKNSMPRELPWLMMLPSNEEEEKEDPDSRVFYSLSKQQIHTIRLPEIRGKRCCGSSQNGWMMIVDEKLDIFLFHPWSKKRIDLPHQSNFNHQNYGPDFYTMEEIRDKHILRSAISDDGNVVVVVYGLYQLAFWRIGHSAYNDIDTGIKAPMEDVVYHKGRFYSLDVVGAIYLLHIDEGFPPRGEKLTEKSLASLIPYTFYGYLVPDILTDSMFVITRDFEFFRIDEITGKVKYIDDDDTNTEGTGRKTVRFDIFRVPLEEVEVSVSVSHNIKFKEPVQVESLGDRVLFLGYNSPIIVMASQFSGFKGNRIYFADNIMETYYRCPYGCCDLGVFSLKDGTIEELFVDRFHPNLSPPLWIERDFGE